MNEAELSLVERALQLINTPSQMVSPFQWLQGFRDLAAITHGVTQDDPQFPGIMEAVAACDAAFEVDDWEAFCKAADKVRELSRCPGVQ